MREILKSSYVPLFTLLMLFLAFVVAIFFLIPVKEILISMVEEAPSVVISVIICATLILLSFIAMNTLFFIKSKETEKLEMVDDFEKRIKKLEEAITKNVNREYNFQKLKEELKKEIDAGAINKKKAEWKINKTLEVFEKIKTTITETTDKDGTKKRVKEEVPKAQLASLMEGLEKELNIGQQ